jgi:hypothetical protein
MIGLCSLLCYRISGRSQVIIYHSRDIRIFINVVIILYVDNNWRLGGTVFGFGSRTRARLRLHMFRLSHLSTLHYYGW